MTDGPENPNKDSSSSEHPFIAGGKSESPSVKKRARFTWIQGLGMGAGVSFALFMVLFYPSVNACSQIQSKIMSGDLVGAVQQYGAQAGWSQEQLQRAVASVPKGQQVSGSEIQSTAGMGISDGSSVGVSKNSVEKTGLTDSVSVSVKRG